MAAARCRLFSSSLPKRGVVMPYTEFSVDEEIANIPDGDDAGLGGGI